MARDSSRLRIQLPNIDSTGNGTNDLGTSTYLCVTGNVSFSGFTRGTMETTCSETTADGWGNVWRIFRGGRFVDAGTLSFDVDWDPDTAAGGLELAAFKDGNDTPQDYVFLAPVEAGETTALSLTFPAVVTSFTPQFGILEDGDESRMMASMELKLSGAPTITLPT